MAFTFDPAEAGPALGRILDSTSQTTVEMVRAVAGEHDARARRHAAIAERLARALGEQDARVVALRRSSDQSRRLALDLTRGATLIGANRTPPPGSLTLTGRITDATGAVVPGVRARLTDRAGTLRVDISGTTDDSGTFFLVVPPDAVPHKTELFLVVEDAKGRALHKSPALVEFEPGVLQRTDLVIEMRPAPDRETAPGAPRRARQRAARKPAK